MTGPANHRTPCPRCGAPVTGDFKFCPTCACRLKEGEPLEENGGGLGERWPHVLVGLLLGLLVIGMVAVGLQLFSPEPPVPTPEPPDPPPAGVLSVRNIPHLMVAVPEGFAGWAPVPGTGEDLQVYVPWFSKILAFEVTRGMYGEFVDAMDEDPERVPEFLRHHWRTSDEYINAWWELYAEWQRTVNEVPKVERPDDFRAPLPDSYGVLLLVPPQWVYVTPYLQYRWKLEEGTEHLPVTGVSWYDAVAFEGYASKLVGRELRLPFDMEWLLAGHGADLENATRYPWGDEASPFACNNLNFWGDRTPQLRRVDQRYMDAPGHTPDGVWALAGNAREWTRNHALELAGDHWLLTVEAGTEAREERAPTLGGSYLEGIEDCTIDDSSRRPRDKGGRWIDVGFRLWTHGDPMGG